MEFLRIIVYSNILIALAAVAQCFLSYIILKEENNIYILCIEGFSTHLFYNISLYLSKPKNHENSPYSKVKWFFNSNNYFWISSSISFIGVTYCVWQTSYFSFLYLVLIGLISISYFLPLYKYKNRKVGLRQVAGLKLFFIATIWVLSGVGLPVVDLLSQNIKLDCFVILYLCLSKFLFLLAITLPFDIRDFKQDLFFGLKTLPVILGVDNAIKLNYALLLFHILTLFFAPYSVNIILGLIVTDILIYFLFRYLLNAKNKSYDMVYLLDFMMIFQLFAVLAFYNLDNFIS